MEGVCRGYQRRKTHAFTPPAVGQEADEERGLQLPGFPQVCVSFLSIAFGRFVYLSFGSIPSLIVTFEDTVVYHTTCERTAADKSPPVKVWTCRAVLKCLENPNL